MKLRDCRLLVVGCLLAWPLSAPGRTIIVDLEGGGDFTEIQPAIDAADDGDVVIVKPGEYRIQESLAFRGKMIVMKAASEHGPEDTVIRMTGDGSVVAFLTGAQGNALLEGLTLTGGTGKETVAGPPQGGGVYCIFASPTLVNCAITANSAGEGGGLFVMGATGLESSPVLVRCRISKNSASEAGGGIYCRGEVSLSLTDCTISENVAESAGAGIYVERASSATIVNCTIEGNSAPEGSGLACDSGSSVTVTNAILWNNSGVDIREEKDGAVTVTYSCVESATDLSGEGNIREDPLFCGWGKDGEVYVDPSASGPADGSPGNPFCCVSSALEGFSIALSSASPCLGTGRDGTDMGADTGRCETPGEPVRLVHLAAGTYEAAGWNLARKVNLQGAGEDSTVIQGPLGGLSTASLLSQVTVVAGPGGGIVVLEEEAPAIEDCTIRGDPEESGAGVICLARSAPVLTRCTITGNHHGGLFFGEGASPSLTDCDISGNRSEGRGSGVYCASDVSAVFVDCSISGNEGLDGAGLYLGSDCLVSLAGCAITGNTASQEGGGVYCSFRCSVSLENSVLAENQTDGYGAAWYCGPESSTVASHCTVSGNLATGGGGLYLADGSSSRIASCIVWDNAGGSFVAQDGSEVTVLFSCIESEDVWPGDGNINADPLLGAWGPRREVHVDASSSGPGDGSPDRPFSTLAAATGGYDLALSKDSPCIEAGEDGADMGADTGHCESPGESTRFIRLAAGTYDFAGCNLAHHVSLEGAGEELSVIHGTVDGLRTGSVLRQVTVTRGTRGGIVAGYGEAPRIEACTITGNSGHWGGGVVCRSESAASFVDCTIRGNETSSRGGGVSCGSGSSATFSSCTIRGNWSSDGGGVACSSGSSALFTECLVAENDAVVGGALWCGGTSSPKFVGCRISGNRARGTGGGIHCSGDSLAELTGCVFVDNQSEIGGAVYCDPGSSPVFTRCTVSGNSAVRGGVMYVAVGSSPRIRSCIVWDNAGGSLVENGDLQADVSFSCIESENVWPGTGNINADPLFCGWGPRGDVYVDAAASSPGDGSPENPFATLAPAIDGFSLMLSKESPCLGSGEGGTDMGADTGRCESPGRAARLVHVAPGTYEFAGYVLTHNVSLQGAGAVNTIIEGAVTGLRGGARLSGFTITDEHREALVVNSGESPFIEQCVIEGGEYAPCASLRCAAGSFPSLSHCTITSKPPRWPPVLCCGADSSPVLTGCIVWRSMRLESGAVLTATYSYLPSKEVWPGDGNINADPLLCGSTDLRLRPGSPCIGAAEDGSNMGADLGVCVGGAPPFRRGDANADGIRNMSDAIFILDHLFRGGPAPDCEKSADCNDDGKVQITDPVFLLNHLFRGKAPPPEPLDSCGQDPTADDLACGSFPPCGN